MAKIKIVSGVFGHKHNGVYDIVRAGDPAIEVDEAVAHRLVDVKRVAKYDTQPAPAPAVADETDAEVDEAVAKPLDELNVSELRELGASYGLTFKVGTTKAAMIEAICQAAESVPQFDAAEAVQ